MARAKFGMMMVDARGKLGGHVFTKTRSGATIRTKVTPSNPQTVAQSGVRALFSALSSQWSNLDPVDREAWQGSVDLYVKTNVFGDAYLPSGKNLFVALNSNLSKVNKTNIAVPKSPISFPALTVTEVEMVLTDAILSINFDGAAPGADYAFYIEATKPNSAGRYNFSGQYRKIYQSSGVALPTSSTLYATYVSKFGVPPAGSKISVRVSLVSVVSGQASTPSNASAIVEA